MEMKALLEGAGVVPSSVVQYDFKNDPYHQFDLSKQNKTLDTIDLNSEESFTNYIFDTLKANNCTVGVGGYGEERGLYSRSELFGAEEPRSIHLGIDVWMAAETPVFSPLDGVIHSFANRAIHGDYGPVIIVQHVVNNVRFHTLYGHLSKDSLSGLEVGAKIKSGQKIGAIGAYHENFHWPPHLHFQVIMNMQGMKGDYPGVAIKSTANSFLRNCPDPAYLLGLA